jgi:uncharacterized protein GlcG (DUF336 family)
MFVAQKLMDARTAMTMAQSAAGYAEENGWEITVAICDPSGVLQAFWKTASVIPSAVDFAIDKAFTAATLRKSTAAFGERMASSAGLSLGLASRKRLTTWAGGLPIFDGGTCVGGIGVSGARDHEDVACALFAVKAVGLNAEA